MIPSLYNVLEEYQKRRPEISAYLKGEPLENFVENYGDPTPTDTTAFFGLSMGLFLLLLVVALGIWIWAIVVLVKYWKKLPDWAKVLGVIGVIPVIPVGPVLTLIVVYVGKQ